eukprot:5380824-Amphidinium_carterae.1
MSVAKACCRPVDPKVHETHQGELDGHPHPYKLESQMICNNRACKQEHVAVQGKKNTRPQQQTLLQLASLIPC